MTISRLFSPSMRSALMIAAGSALIGLPIALGLSEAAIATSVTVGILAWGLGISGTANEGRGTLSVAAHAAYDRGLALGLFLVAIAFGIADESAAAVFFAASALATFLVSALTRYSVSTATR
jgi:hypothetical protein